GEGQQDERIAVEEEHGDRDEDREVGFDPTAGEVNEEADEHGLGDGHGDARDAFAGLAEGEGDGWDAGERTEEERGDDMDVRGTFCADPCAWRVEEGGGDEDGPASADRAGEEAIKVSGIGERGTVLFG